MSPSTTVTCEAKRLFVKKNIEEKITSKTKAVFITHYGGVPCEMDSIKELCDKNNILRKQFGVPKALGFIEGRVTYIINSQGIIIHIFEDLLNGPAHIKEAIRALKKIQ